MKVWVAEAVDGERRWMVGVFEECEQAAAYLRDAATARGTLTYKESKHVKMYLHELEVGTEYACGGYRTLPQEWWGPNKSGMVWYPDHNKFRKEGELPVEHTPDPTGGWKTYGPGEEPPIPTGPNHKVIELTIAARDRD